MKNIYKNYNDLNFILKKYSRPQTWKKNYTGLFKIIKEMIANIIKKWQKYHSKINAELIDI
jgi:hypothetical protein